MDESEIQEVVNFLANANPVEYARFVIEAMRDERKRNAELIRAYANQLPDDHPAKKYIIEISDTLLKQ